MVNPLEEGEASPRPLLERLRKAPKKVLKFLSEAPVACVSNPCVCKILLAKRAAGHFCAGNGSRLHGQTIRRVPVRGSTCSRANCT
jgi:hypothetical protein